MYGLPSRTDVGTVIVDEAVINGTSKPTYKAERLPQVTAWTGGKKDLRSWLSSKSA